MSAVLNTKRKPLALAISAVVSVLSISPVISFAADQGSLVQQSSEQSRSEEMNTQAQFFSISSGELEGALNQLGKQAGILLSFKPDQVAQYRVAGFKGQYTLYQVQQRLLSDTPWQLIQHKDGSYQLAEKSKDQSTGQTQQLSTLEITAQQNASGLTVAGYRVDMVENLGALSGRDLLDTPYSVHSLSSSLFENIQASTPAEAQKLNPFVHLNQRQTSGFSNFVNIRGFTGDAWKQKFEEGMRASSLSMIAMEDKARMEVMNGLSGFLYGMSSPSGTVNYVLKRPESKPLYRLRAGNNGGKSYFAHADLSDRLADDGRVAYRLNILGQSGDTAVDDQKEKRVLLSGALDYQVRDNLRLRFDASHHQYDIDAPNTIWQFIGKPHFDAPDSGQQWGQKWSFSDVTTNKMGSDLDWDVSEQIAIRGGLSFSRTDREYILSANGISPQLPDNMYVPVVLTVPTQQHGHTAGYLFTDIKTQLAGVEHTFTAGLSADHYKTREHQDYTNRIFMNGVGSVSLPVYLPELSDDELNVGNLPRITTADGQNLNITLADSLVFNEQWSAITGITHTRIQQKTYANPVAGVTGQSYDKHDITPAISLLYKPRPEITTYISYLEGLEQGGVAPVGSLNEGDIMSPVVSTQLELGAKARVGQMALTAALFDMERANEFLDSDGYFKQEGKQISRGLELSATGRLNNQLMVIAGLTVLDAKVKEQGNQTPVEVAEKLGKLYMEYTPDFLVPGLTLTAGAFYTGKIAVDSANTEYLPSYTLYDAGVRYQLDAGKHPVTFSLNVKNLTDEDYWLNSLYQGDPRTITFAARVDF